jgi:Coenzyme PQQ synthesis protein D (PqqD)
VRRPAIERRLDGDRVLLDMVGRAAYVLNPTAWAVWELCDGARSAEEVVAGLARRYRVPEATAAPGCLATLAFLEAVGLVIGAGGARAASTSAGMASVGADV